MKIQYVINLIVFLIFCFYSTNSFPAIYKWTDENGNVHYSDKKPSNNAKEENVNIGMMPDSQVVEEKIPKKYKGSYLGDWLSVAEPSYKLLDKNGRKTKNLYFYFGGDCISPTFLSFNEFTSNYASILDSTEFLQRQAVNQFRHYLFDVLHSAENDRPMYKNKKRHDLYVEVVGLRINACSRKTSQQSQFGSLNNFNVYSFYKSNAWVKMKWTLIDQKTKAEIFTAYSEGAANNITSVNRTLALTYRDAFGKSVVNFLTNEVFLSYIGDNQPVSHVEKRQALPAVTATEPGFLGQAANSMQLGYLKTASFGQAFSLVVPLKTIITSYYLTNDVWPISFRDVSMEEGSLRERDLIKHVSLRGDGVIHVELDDDKFGVGHYFQLVPRVSMNRMRLTWDCVTTLDQTYGVSACIREL